MTSPLDVPETATQAQPEAVLAGAGRAIEGRSLGQIAWLRLRRDRVALAGGVVIVVLILAAIAAPLLTRITGGSPTDFHQDLVDPTFSKPKGEGTFAGFSWEHPLGVEPRSGRDVFSRILYGAQISLLIGFLATLVSVAIGTLMGIVAGYFGGWVDTLISRLMDAFLAFPLLLFALALAGVIPDRAFGLSGNTLRIAVLVFIIGFFNWPYIGRIIRGQTLSLREREFVDAARSLGARGRWVMFKEMLPNLAAPILVYSTLMIPANILFEAALSFLGVGIRPPTPSWGKMLADAVPFYSVAPMYLVVPGLAIFVTVMAFNLLGDGLRDALDPRAR
ncbi:ABC transporter permease [Longispora albida]|uniref:ABC transporter permease n=1 Tax=Longispora albida TaxID=203523 RepID=UPI00035F0811|nr:ABC transporter permease [Longispora albida]